MSPALAYASYRNAEITTLNQRDLIVKLYQGAERFLLQAAMAIDADQPESAATGARKARAIFAELLSTLDRERGGDIASQLAALYTFFITDITDAMAVQDANELRKIVPIVANLREAWEAIPNDIAQESSTPDKGHSIDLRR